MEWGLKNRLASIIKPHNNRALMLAVDHGYFLGPTEKLENPRKTIAPLLKYCDSLMLTRGVQRTSVDPSTSVPMVLRVSGGASIIGEDLSQEQITVSLKDAIKINASALAMSIFVGSKYEHQTIVNLGRLVNEAEEYGIPVLAVTAVGKELGKDARYLSLACRIAAEQGAHVVKTYYCDNFEKVVNSCPVPIIVAGGKKIPERDAMQLTYNAIRGGAVGVDMGRNIWQSQNPVAMIRAIRAIVHGNAKVDQAYALYKSLLNETKPKQNQPQKFFNKPQQKQQNKPQQKQQNKPQQKQQNKPQQKQQNKPQQKQQNKPQQKQQNKPQQKQQNKPQQKQQNKPQQKQQNKPQQKQQNKPQQKQSNPAPAK